MGAPPQRNKLFPNTPYTLTLLTQPHETGYRSTEILLQIPEKILLNLKKAHELLEARNQRK